MYDENIINGMDDISISMSFILNLLNYEEKKRNRFEKYQQKKIQK